jgi:hypothetical protein
MPITAAGRATSYGSAQATAPTTPNANSKRTRQEMIVRKTQILADQSIRALRDDELDAVKGGGGSIDSWLAGQPSVVPRALSLGWTFVDVFAKHTIGQ